MADQADVGSIAWFVVIKFLHYFPYTIIHTLAHV